MRCSYLTSDHWLAHNTDKGYTVCIPCNLDICIHMDNIMYGFRLKASVLLKQNELHWWLHSSSSSVWQFYRCSEKLVKSNIIYNNILCNFSYARSFFNCNTAAIIIIYLLAHLTHSENTVQALRSLNPSLRVLVQRLGTLGTHLLMYIRMYGNVTTSH